MRRHGGRRALAIALVSVVATGFVQPAATSAAVNLGYQPWSGSFSQTQSWSNLAALGLSYAGVYTDQSDPDAPPMDPPQLSCTGSETLTFTTTGDGAQQSGPNNWTQPFSASGDYSETCTGSYDVYYPNQENPTSCPVTVSASGAPSRSRPTGFSTGYDSGQAAWNLYADAYDGAVWENLPKVSASIVQDDCRFIRVDPFPSSLGAETGMQAGPDPSTMSIGQQYTGHEEHDFADYHWTHDWDLTWNGPPACAAAATPPTSGDSDGDRLPNTYETGQLGTLANDVDTDNDCFSDTIEVASGSSPLNAGQTPDTLSRGIAPKSLSSSGRAGITCGRTLFRWVTPSLDYLGVPAGTKGCILLVSNRAANALLDYAKKYGVSMTTAFVSVMGPHLVEVYGDRALNWVREAAIDSTVWAGKLAVKQAILKSLNLTRLNLIFTAGTAAGLTGVALGAIWAAKQVREKKACVQIRIGRGATGGTRLSWSLVYNQQNLTREGLDDELHKASVWKKKARDNAPDTAVRRAINLRCSNGSVVASGSGAGEVFDGAKSFIF